MAKQRIIGIRVDETDYERFKALAKADDRKVASFCKRILLRELANLNPESTSKIKLDPKSRKASVPGKSRDRMTNGKDN